MRGSEREGERWEVRERGKVGEKEREEEIGIERKKQRKRKKRRKERKVKKRKKRKKSKEKKRKEREKRK